MPIWRKRCMPADRREFLDQREFSARLGVRQPNQRLFWFDQNRRGHWAGLFHRRRIRRRRVRRRIDGRIDAGRCRARRGFRQRASRPIVCGHLRCWLGGLERLARERTDPQLMNRDLPAKASHERATRVGYVEDVVGAQAGKTALPCEDPLAISIQSHTVLADDQIKPRDSIGRQYRLADGAGVFGPHLAVDPIAQVRLPP